MTAQAELALDESVPQPGDFDYLQCNWDQYQASNCAPLCAKGMMIWMQHSLNWLSGACERCGFIYPPITKL